MATNNIILQSVNTQGWRMGFRNVFLKEHNEWWRTRLWLRRSILWLVLINGILLATLLKAPARADVSTNTTPDAGVIIFVIMDGILAALGIIIVMQGAILDEKKSGTAAWVLSKPLSRTAFILAKLAANGLAALLIMVVLQGVIAFGLLRAFAPSPPAFIPFLLGLGLLALNLLFYLTLTLMVGTFSNARGGVLGIPMGLLFGSQFLIGLPSALTQFMPWSIVLPTSETTPALAQAAMLGQPLPTVIPIIATALWIVIFIGVAIWRFQREEF